jgi:nucleoside recognition membrane protein YjiH
VEFVVDKVALGQVFSEYFGSPCQSSFHFSTITIIYHPALVQ